MSYNHHVKQYAKQRGDFSSDEIQKLSFEFQEKNDYLRSTFAEITPKAFYRGLFPVGSFEHAGDFGDGQVRRPNGIISVIRDKEEHGRSYNRILFDDLDELDLVMGKEFVIISPIAYSGRRRLEKYAYTIYGMAIDLDYVQVKNIQDLFFQMENGLLPQASYIVNSGTGLHVYYAFEEPIPAMPKYFPNLNKLKAGLSNIVWNQYTSTSKDKQFQSIFQGYRVPGTQTKIREDCLVTVFQTGKPVTVSWLNRFVDSEHRSDFNDMDYVSLDSAKELWPGWYQRRIVDKQPVGNYSLSETERKRRRAWYETWIMRIKGGTRKGKNYQMGAYDGNRYYCMCVLFQYAMKAEIPLEEAERDAFAMIDDLNKLTKNPKNQFTREDVIAAEVYYDRKYIKMGRDAIKRMTGVDIGKTRRNPEEKRISRSKDKDGNSNLSTRAWKVRDALYPDKSWINKDGRPKKKEIVCNYVSKHPEKSPTEVAKILGVSRTTVYKYRKMESLGKTGYVIEHTPPEDFGMDFEKRLEFIMQHIKKDPQDD